MYMVISEAFLCNTGKVFSVYFSERMFHDSFEYDGAVGWGRRGTRMGEKG